MATSISHDGINRGFQAGVINGNIGNVIIGQTEPLDQACLRDLRTTNPYDDKERIKKTGGGLLEDSYRWILRNEAFQAWRENQCNRLLGIRGGPGKGKTMLLCGLIEELAKTYGDNMTISYFFCQATDMRINSATSVLRGLIYLLVEKNPPLLRHVRARYDTTGKDLFEDINAWNALVYIFTKILEDPHLKHACLVIDALDECQTGCQDILDLIIEKSSSYPHIKWIISSRNREDIIESLDSATQIAPISLELNEAAVSEAVNVFIRYKVDLLAKKKRYNPETREKISRHLLFNSQGTFLWVALVWKNLDRTPRRHAIENLEIFPPGLDALYNRMMDQVRESKDAELCKQILGIVSTVYRPITLSELQSLVKGRNNQYNNIDTLSDIIAVCGSFLTLRKYTVVFVHQSAKDFLLREIVAEILPEAIESEHYAIFSQSLNILLKTLRRDMFDIKLSGIPASDISIPSPNPLAIAEYACIFWVDHLYACKNNTTYRLSLNRDLLDMFLQQKYLHWLEALSILGTLSEGIKAVKKLESLIQEEGELEDLLEQARDASRFIQYHRTGVESSPLQVYYSPLIFSPSKSLTRKAFQEERPNWLLNNPVVQENWSPCLQTLEGHSGWVRSISWSPDGRQLASGSSDNTVQIWDPATGQRVSTLEGHSRSVQSIAWSPDGSRLASGSEDQAVRIWDPVTGQSVYTLEGHSYMVWSITWSPDGKRLASGSSDNTVQIWDPATGQRVSTLKGHIDSVNIISWSPDRRRLVSGSYDKTIRIWDPTTGKIVSTLEGYSSLVQSIAWSPDGSRLASASYNNIQILDPLTGQILSTLTGHIGWVQSIAWSPDGNRLASGSEDQAVRIWDPDTGQSVCILEGHSHTVLSITWSPDGKRLASGSKDKTVRIWDPAARQSVPTLEGHSYSVQSIAWSPDGSRIASGSLDRTIRIWDPATGQTVSTLEGQNRSIQSIAWSPDGRQLASESSDNTVQIWDPATGQTVSTLEGHIGSIQSIAWSPDGSRIASGSLDRTIRIWDPATGQTVSTLEGHNRSIQSIAWSPNGSRIASGSLDRTIRIWDPATGQTVSTLNGHIGWVQSIAWSIDGSRLASGSSDNTVRIWDLATCQSVSTLLTSTLQFDNDSNRLSASVGVFDTGSMALMTPVPDSFIQPLKQRGYGLSNDRSWITYNGLKLLWLPSEYRPSSVSHFSVHASKVAIACSSNHIIFLALSKQ